MTQRPSGSSYRVISIGGLQQPTAAVLSALAKGYAELPGIRTLDEAGAAALAEDDADSSVSLPELEELSPAAAAQLAKRRGYLRLGLKTLSARAAMALAASKGRVRLHELTTCPPTGLAALKAMPGLLVIPPALHTPLERCLWCLTGWAKVAVLALLGSIVALLAAGFVLVRRVATDRPVSVEAVHGVRLKRALLPAIIAVSILVGMSTFLGLKVLPQHLKYWDDFGGPLPVGMYRGLDLLLCVLVAAALGNFAYAWFVRRQLQQSLQPVWSMRQHFCEREEATRLFLSVLFIVYIGLHVWILSAFLSPVFDSWRHVGLFFAWWFTRDGVLVALFTFILPVVWVMARPFFRSDRAEVSATLFL